MKNSNYYEESKIASVHATPLLMNSDCWTLHGLLRCGKLACKVCSYAQQLSVRHRCKCLRAKLVSQRDVTVRQLSSPSHYIIVIEIAKLRHFKPFYEYHYEDKLLICIQNRDSHNVLKFPAWITLLQQQQHSYLTRQTMISHMRHIRKRMSMHTICLENKVLSP